MSQTCGILPRSLRGVGRKRPRLLLVTAHGAAGSCWQEQRSCGGVRCRERTSGDARTQMRLAPVQTRAHQLALMRRSGVAERQGLLRHWFQMFLGTRTTNRCSIAGWVVSVESPCRRPSLRVWEMCILRLLVVQLTGMNHMGLGRLGREDIWSGAVDIGGRLLFLDAVSVGASWSPQRLWV